MGQVNYKAPAILTTNMYYEVGGKETYGDFLLYMTKRNRLWLFF